MKFSVLMSVYQKENPCYFNRAMQSIWDDQSIKPSEIVLVEDGKLTDELYLIIEEWTRKLNGILVVVKLDRNMGLGYALRIGLSKCKYDLVARMDTDDVSLPSRFMEQLKFFSLYSIDICGSWISEFELDETCTTGIRKVPKSHFEIVRFAKKRSPLNHPSVMFRKESVLAVGSYKEMLFFEDYYLWARMIVGKKKFYNIQKILVKMRAGEAQLSRRSGIRYAVNELKANFVFYRIGFLSLFEFVVYTSLKFVTRIMPKMIIKLIYSQIRLK